MVVCTSPGSGPEASDGCLIVLSSVFFIRASGSEVDRVVVAVVGFRVIAAVK